MTEELIEEDNLVIIDLDPIEVNAVITKADSILFIVPEPTEVEKKANVEIHGINLHAQAIKKIEVGEPIEARNFSSHSDVKKIVAEGNYSWIIQTEDNKKYLFFY